MLINVRKERTETTTMDIKHYNGNVTKGRYEIDSFQLHRLFPGADPLLVDYILDKSYVSNGVDKRVKRVFAEYDAVTYYRVILDAAAKVRGEDTFNEEDGEMIVKLKLHDKAASFISGFSKKLQRECKLMKERVEHCPNTVIAIDAIDPAVPKQTANNMLQYSITDDCSYAKLEILPYAGVGGGIRGLCYEIAQRAASALRERGGVSTDARLLVDQFEIEFAKDIERAFAAKSKYIGGGNWQIKKAFGNVESVMITVHTKKSPDDKHDPAVAAKELVQRLNRALNRLEAIMRQTASGVLCRYLRLGRVSKAIASTRELRTQCIDKGLVTLEKYPLLALDDLQRIKREFV